MSDIFKLNKSEYSDDSGMEYLKKDYHVKRIAIAIDLIKEEVSKSVNKKDLNLLSLGCSTGIIEKDIKKQTGVSVHGLEASSACAKKATARGINMKVGDVTKKLPYTKNSFDFVFAGEVIEHVIDARAFLLEIKRVLKPGGFLILTTPNLARIDDRVKFLFGKAPRHTNPMHEILYLHIRPFTFSSLKDSLHQTGYKIKAFKANYVVADIGKLFLKSRVLAKLFPSLGGSMIVKAQVKK
ncbi:class I SAM-dependent methyltransferase [Candidatus Parcubacteria bacterium]|jgi:2-polyprenyl-3-methyl-5-hydroxy-6-metoxy-1,4-benzoquinol methylase|nr:class I SAM-dependent methyltransferase [Candidatus Parcubacteria bacterium]